MMTEHAKHIESVRTARKALDSLSGKDLPKIMAREMAFIASDVFGQLLMEHLPEGYMTMDHKVFWISVAEYLGPDGIDALKKVGAFMAKTNEF
jgi:hypothetical protein